MPPPSSRMTKNQERNFRYRPGKAAAHELPSDEDSEQESEDEQQEALTKASVPAPKVSTFPSQKKLAVDLSKGAGQQGYVNPAPKAQDEDLEGFVTASESSEEEGVDGSSDEEEEESSDEESSSDEEPAKPMLAPRFISKAQRSQQAPTSNTRASEDAQVEDERRRQEKADELLQAQLERDAAARAAGRKAWDDDDNIEEEVDDTDDIDPEAERAAWKLRELKRVRRDRLAIEEKEREREEIERRRNMAIEEREAEDKLYIDAQKEEREGRGKMSYMQKYHHKGAFFGAAGGEGQEQDEEVKAALNRDLAGARYADDVSKEVLPEYMKIRDMSKLGKKGRTKYKDLKNEDTGRWAEYGKKRRDFDGVQDDRFRPDERREGGRERTGANDVPVGERRRRDEDGYRDRDDKRVRYD